MGKKKGVSGGVNELITSIKRHYNNVLKDPERQKIINLFLGIYNPMTSSVPIWNMNDDVTLNNLANDIPESLMPQNNEKLKEMNGTKWWVPFLEDFEYSLPEFMRKDQSEIVTRNPDSDSDEDMLNQYIQN